MTCIPSFFLRKGIVKPLNGGSIVELLKESMVIEAGHSMHSNYDNCFDDKTQLLCKQAKRIDDILFAQ